MVELHDLALTIEADSIIIPEGLTEENLFFFLRQDILECLIQNVIRFQPSPPTVIFPRGLCSAIYAFSNFLQSLLVPSKTTLCFTSL